MKRNAPQLAGISVPVGPFDYQLRLIDGFIPLSDDLGGGDGAGLCDGREQYMLISSKLGPRRRLQTFYHELAHAWSFDLDQSQTGVFEGEQLATLVEIGMARLDSKLLARIERFLADDANAVPIDAVYQGHSVCLAAKANKPTRRQSAGASINSA